ncbi:AraC family transcriptional regulator [Permianibacter aggregans]|uniref:AraC family transcriptional regulator n=1 Tax=Permianibacter aggregans TaxID=1510150 RepID=A0A4R6ULV1_9GAMM|nr:AraC family transcriptional regulator [Permianibacter aggregans]QGX40979.1 AraC family transcriptional regulator [Permianibacter aggregans]TDQ48038.1 AraC family transcriptional regulator [Permianibacter aggregans]
MDRLSALLSHFSVSAGLFHSGGYCGVQVIGDVGNDGHLHFLKQGRLELWLPGQGRQVFDQPSLLFFPRPLSHRFQATEADGTELVCASLQFDGGVNNPISRALPDFLQLPLADMPGIQPSLQLLFDEAFQRYCGRLAVLNRLFEVLVIQILRHLMANQSMSTGLLSGLADPQLAPVLTSMHEQPAEAWTLERLARLAGMSRASFARHFHERVGMTVGDYLLSWRVALAQQKLRQGRPMKLVSGEVGYDSPSALARAFRRQTGHSPSDWLKSHLDLTKAVPA